LIDKRYFAEPTINDLFNWYTSISNEVFDILKSIEPPTLTDYRYLCSIMAESHQIYTELEWRNLIGRCGKTLKGKTIYLAHSSSDKGRVRMLHDDLKALGHKFRTNSFCNWASAKAHHGY